MSKIQEAEQFIMHTYNRYPVILDHGDGVYLYDDEGKKYLDFGAGIAVFSLGYHNKEFNDALKGQIDKLIHTSNLFYNQPAIDAAKKIVEASGLHKVFFTNSGTEAIEGALKVAKKYAYQKDPSKEYEIIAMDHSFHGRSQGALAVTGTPKYREGFVPKGMSAVFANYNDLEDVTEKVTENTCAIILEVVQGEGGIYPAKKEFLEGIRSICDEKDILLIFDEVQCGMGRCGTMFAHELYGIKPDVMALAKGIGNGVPVGAFVVDEKYDALVPGDHGTTYGGNPFAATAVNKVFDIIEEQNILENVKVVGAYLEGQLGLLMKETSVIKDHRGIGLMQGIQLEESLLVSDVIKKAMEKGLILIAAGNNTIRFVPPLIITKEHVDEMIGILKECLN